MKSDELVRMINNGEIKDGTKIEFRLTRKEPAYIYYRNKNLVYGEKSNGAGQFVDIGLLLDSNFEFEIVEEHKGWFKPKNGEWYWCINSCGVLNRDNWDGGEVDLYRYNRHNCFRTEEEAQEYLDYTNALKEAEKPFVYGKDNCCIEFDEGHNRLYVTEFSHIRNQGITYLGQDEAVAQAFIDKWKDCILKYEFDVWE